MTSKMSSLQQLCSLLPFNPWHWFRLGQTCLQLLEGDEPAGVKIIEEPQEEAAELEQDKLWLKACSCYVRTRCNDQLVFYCQVSDHHKNP